MLPSRSGLDCSNFVLWSACSPLCLTVAEKGGPLSGRHRAVIADGVVVHRTSSTQRLPMKLHARYVTVSDFDDQYFEVSFCNEHPAADYDPDAPMRPYVLLQRQFEDEDGDVCYLETHDPDRYAGHLRLRLVEFTPTRLAFEIDRPQDRLVQVTFRLGARRFREIQRVVNIIFGLNV